MSLSFDEAFDDGDGLRRYLGGSDDSLRFPSTTNFENIAFGLIEDGLDFMGTFVGPDNDLGAGLLEFAEKAFVLNLLKVGFGCEDTDDSCSQITNQGGSAGSIGQFPIGQPSEEGGWINGLAALAHLGDTTEDDLMGGMEEILFPHALFPSQIDDVVWIGKHGSEKGSFGFKIVMSRKALDRNGGRGIPTDAGTIRLSFGNHRNIELPTGGWRQSRGKSCWGILWAKDG